jgi:uncharacterized membrane protein YphA (DoxX/SURF4 family)
VQRTFSSFPSGAPGLALLAQRFTVGALAAFQFGMVASHAPSLVALVALVPAVSGVALLAGLLTPIAGSIVFCAVAVSLSSVALYFGSICPLARFEILVMAGSIVFLGPGAYSADARLFGRRQVSINGSNSA